jgi:hypothetical protein
VPGLAYRIPGPSFTSRLRFWLRLRSGSKIAVWPVFLLLIVAVSLELGVWQKEYFIHGPFEADILPPQHSLLVNVPAEKPAEWWRQPLLGDAPDKPFRSILQLRIGGHDIRPPHREPDALQNGTAIGFSHRDSVVLFSLPPDVKNAAGTIATLHYSLRPRPWVTPTLAFFTALLGWFGYGPRLGLRLPILRLLGWFGSRLSILRRRTSDALGRIERPAAFVLGLPSLVLLGLGCLALLASTGFILTSLYAAATGWALPTTALIRWSAMAQWAARNEPHTGHLLVTLAASGALAAWLARLNPACQQAVERGEMRLKQFLFRFGLIIAASMFLFCTSAMWSGFARPGDLDFANIGGLVPFSDAANYLTALHDQAKDGVWNSSALWRPLAIAFRSVLFAIANFSLSAMLILQALLVAGALCFAARAVILWRGVWAGLAFFALVYLYARSFTATPLTEPLGLFWALLAIPFFIDAIVSGSARSALSGFAMTVVALMIRMGSMFTIPALLLWLIWQFGHDTAVRLRIFAAATAIVLAVLSLNALLPRAYGTGTGITTGNFAYVFCGLTMGTGWDGCLKKLAADGKELSTIGEGQVEILKAKAWENLRNDPRVFLARLADNAKLFVQNFPDVIWRGYGTEILEPEWLNREILMVISLAGLFYLAKRVAQPAELRFWLLFWISIVASASVIYLDDSPRTLAVSQPLMALFLAIGLSGPVPATSAVLPKPVSRYGWLAPVLAAALSVSVPWMLHRFSPIHALAGRDLDLKPDEAAVFGGRRMTGFLVVANGSPLRHDIATLNLAQFDAIIRRSGVEVIQGLIHPVTPPLPFGFIFAPRIEPGVASANQYIVPAEVLERPDVPAWRFKLQRWGYKGIGEYWYRVTHAEPLRANED